MRTITITGREYHGETIKISSIVQALTDWAAIDAGAWSDAVEDLISSVTDPSQMTLSEFDELVTGQYAAADLPANWRSMLRAETGAVLLSIND